MKNEDDLIIWRVLWWTLINGKSICNLFLKIRKKNIPGEKSSGVFLSVFLTSSHGIYLFIFLKGYRINKSCNINFLCCCVIQGTLGICCKEKTDTDLIQWHLQNQAHRSENITFTNLEWMWLPCTLFQGFIFYLT